MARMVAEIGWVTKIDQSPWLIDSALRSCFSAMGPRIMPTITGAVGKSKRRMAMPSTPMMNSSSRSNHDWRMP